MTARLSAFSSLILLFLAAPSCDWIGGGSDTAQSDSVPVQISLSLQGQETATRASGSITELTNINGTDGNFRGMEDIYVIPFDTEDTVRAGDIAIGYLRKLPDIGSSIDEAAYSNYVFHHGLIRNNHAHLYPSADAHLPRGTSSMLVYGSGKHLTGSSVQEEKHRNGSMIVNGLDNTSSLLTPTDITFSPDPIFTGVIPSQAQQLARIMSSIASGVSYTQQYYYVRNGLSTPATVTVRWNENLTETSLRQYYKWFTGDGELMTGAGGNVEYLLSNLYGRLSRFNSDDEDVFMHVAGGVEYEAVITEGGDDTFTYGDLYNGLRDSIKWRFSNLADNEDIIINTDNTVRFMSENLRDYPVSMGLPAGSAVLRWNGLEYVVVTEGLEGIAAMDRYCYMPPLYYYANSTLSTSRELDVYDVYTPDRSWNQILATYRSGGTVSKSTHSVALDEKLTFATALLVGTIRASASYLADNDNDPRTNCSVEGHNFPVTGILIGNQYRQSFDFAPDNGTPEYFLYDNQIEGVYLQEQTSGMDLTPFRTLVFPTPKNTDVFFFLELRNDSGAAFTGAEGLILPGNYFYLTGKLEHSDDPDFPSVFMRDHYTTVNCLVTSLENAHVAVPELGGAQLVLGVQTSTNWTMSASSYVVLD